MITTAIKPKLNVSLYLKKEDDHYIIIYPKDRNNLIDLFEYLRNARPLENEIDYKNGEATPQLQKPYILYDHVKKLKIEIFGKVKNVTITKPEDKLIAVINSNPRSNDVQIETLQFDTFDELFSHGAIESIFHEPHVWNHSMVSEQEIEEMIEKGIIEDPSENRVQNIIEKLII